MTANRADDIAHDAWHAERPDSTGPAPSELLEGEALETFLYGQPHGCKWCQPGHRAPVWMHGLCKRHHDEAHGWWR